MANHWIGFDHHRGGASITGKKQLWGEGDGCWSKSWGLIPGYQHKWCADPARHEGSPAIHQNLNHKNRSFRGQSSSPQRADAGRSLAEQAGGYLHHPGDLSGRTKTHRTVILYSTGIFPGAGFRHTAPAGDHTVFSGRAHNYRNRSQSCSVSRKQIDWGSSACCPVIPPR